MRLLSILSVIGGIFFGISMIWEPGTYSKYHTDGIRELNMTSGPPSAKTGAPGESNCTDCHSGTTMSAAGNVSYSFSGAGDIYIPGQSYTVDLGMTSVTKAGFQLTILDANDNAAGTFTPGTSSDTQSSGGREYVQHTATAANAWSFTWNAPINDMGDLTVYYAFNETNSAFTTSGDQIYLGQETIGISPEAGITKYQKLDENYSAYYDASSREIVINYQTLKESKVVINVQDRKSVV